jgi:hypothetical protein
MRERYPTPFVQLATVTLLLSANGCWQSEKVHKAGSLPDTLYVTPFGAENHKYGGIEGKVLIDKTVPYLDGALGKFHYRDDGKLLSTSETYEPDSTGVRKPKSEASFTPAGKVLKGFLRRPDGTTRLSTELLPDGSRVRQYYWPESNRLFMRQLTSAAGSTRQEYLLRDNGNTWAKIDSVKSHWWREHSCELFRDDQTRQYRLDEVDGFKRVSVYRGCGEKLDHVSYWKYSHDQLIGGYNHLHGLDEYDTEGKIARCIVFTDFEGRISPKACQLPCDDGWMIMQFSDDNRSGQSVELLSWRDGKGELKQRLLMPFGPIASVTLPKGSQTPLSRPPRLDAIDIWRVRELDLSAFEQYKQQFRNEKLDYCGMRIANDPLRWYLQDD